jgi:hypothetical protein
MTQYSGLELSGYNDDDYDDDSVTNPVFILTPGVDLGEQGNTELP